jgi:hypothetical protein
MPQEGMVEADRVADLESIRRIERDALVALLNLDVPQDLDCLARHAELFHARVLDHVDPGRRAAVHDRHFAVVELDEHVVDAHGPKRREQVLDGLDGCLTDDQPRLELLASAEVRDVRGNLHAAEVDSLEFDSVISGRRMQ